MNRRLPQSGVMIFLVCASTLLLGCPPKTDSPTPPAAPPDATAVIDAHNLNASRLQQIDATGVLQIRWVTEGGGTREEQGDAHLWIDKPLQSALRVSKLGEDLLWLGSDEERFWLFDLLDDDNRALITYRHGTALTFGEGDDAIELQPTALFDLMGITEVQAADAEPAYDVEHECWLIAATGRAGPLQLCWDPDARQVIGLRLLGSDGKPRLISSLRRRASVDIFDGVAFERPQMATLIDFEQPAGKGRLKLALEPEIFGNLEDQPVDRLFNLDVLRRRFSPHHVRGDLDE